MALTPFVLASDFATPKFSLSKRLDWEQTLTKAIPYQGRRSLSPKSKFFKSELAFGTYNRP